MQEWTKSPLRFFGCYAAIQVNSLFRFGLVRCGRAVLDRLSSTTLSEIPAGGAEVASRSGLLPAPLDAAAYSVVAANATCGDNGPEDFCRDTPGKRGLVCDVCEGVDGSPARRHPAVLALDGDPTTWWQSPTHAGGQEFSHIELVATLPAVSNFTFV
ncbi:Laminin subunit alpha-1 [Papilio xuthus]|uniref:Laminin subunit alpha-1 n=1 Tax=Papilio xuthus TaxID=66420 RepID=A0A194Q4Y2_PAPXU|nr:Laminin subunit alpha-1 [Papilio xuthus]